MRRSRGGAGWRLALRIARRDALRARGRSLLVLLMIALPVLGVTAAVVAQRTTDVTVAEGLDRTIGAAQARVDVDTGQRFAVAQSFDDSTSTTTGDELTTAAPTDTSLAALLDAPVIEIVQTDVAVQSDDGVVQAEGLEADLTDPLTAGLVDLTSGRLPRDASEVVVNQAMLDQGHAVGELLLTRDATDGPRIVGVAESAAVRTYPFAAGPVGSLPVSDDLTTRSYLVGGGPVSWDRVRDLNAEGASVVSRAVVLDPPPSSELPAELGGMSSSGGATTVTVVALVVTMALLEVVLLAGPAFAVGARRLQRTLALMVAAGATPRQARRVVLGGAVVLGSVAAVVGVVAGTVVGAVALAILQSFSDTWFGPFEVPVLPVLVVAAFGLLSALLAALVPARLASRQDVAAVLAGRRGDAPPSYRSPLLGAILLGVGVAMAVLGATGGSGEVLIALAALMSVLGMVLLVPLVVSAVARLATRMPLSLRYAARDAARHRTRTAPAVAAVAATVAGVVALLVANTSDGAENEATYRPMLASGVGFVSLNGVDPADVDQASGDAVVRHELPDATLTPVQGITYFTPSDSDVYRYTSVVEPGADADGFPAPLATGGTSGAYGADLLVSDDDLPPGIVGLSAADAAAAHAALAAGQVVAFTDADPGAAPSSAQVVLHTVVNDASGQELDPVDQEVTATVVHLAELPASAVLPWAVAATLDQPVGRVGTVVTDTDVTKDQEEAITEALAATSSTAMGGATFSSYRFYVERGYTAASETLVLQLVLLGLGGVLMLGGTLTATFLALADARPDLATLAAIGASPRRRRGVAAGYALVVGFVGAVLGALVGFVPGLAVAFPLTTVGGGTVSCVGSCSGTVVSGSGTGPFIDVPWLMILGLVVVLPLLTAAIVAAATRSRLPMVTRIE